MKIGIDLGTTNSVMSYIDDNGIPKIIKNADGDSVTPSVIFFEGDNLVVGESAKEANINDPQNGVIYVKRQMGNKNFTHLNDSGERFSSEELSAIILKKLKSDAEQALNERISSVVVTVPAYFGDAERTATIDAAKIAGFPSISIINEPTAAAIAYGYDSNVNNQNIAIYDLGGGTFDIVIMNINNGKYEILATQGDKNLGGFDFDNILFEYVSEILEDDYDVDVFEDPYLVSEIREKVESAKKTLGNRNIVKIMLNVNGNRINIDITADKFNELIEPLISRTMALMEITLEDANLSWVDIDKTIMVGGSTRLRSISAKILELTGKEPSFEVDPDEVVASGAALYAHIISDDEDKKTSGYVRIVDVNSHSLGVIANGQNDEPYNDIILKKNTQLPAVERKRFFIPNDYQEHLHVQVTEGEDLEVDYVTLVGSIMIDISSRKMLSGTPIYIHLSYDENGVIDIKVEDGRDNSMIDSFTLNRSSNLTQKEINDNKTKLDNLEIV